MNFFPRQWFNKDIQYGLSSDAILYESYLKKRDFISAINHLKSCKSSNLTYWERRLGQLCKIMRFLSKENNIVYVNFIGFWSNFRVEDNQFIDLLNIIFPKYAFIGTQDQDISLVTFFSCYGDLNNLEKDFHSVRILYLGENVRPIYSFFDYSLTSDIWEYASRNIYYPPWMLEIDWEESGKKFTDRKPVKASDLNQSRVINVQDRLSKVVYIGNNSEPFRESLISCLISNGIDVDCYGSQSKPVDNKQVKLSEYKITLCPENSLFEGYVTEKPIHSYLANTVGIYRGGYISSHMQINANPMYILPYNLTDYRSDSLIKKVVSVLESDTITVMPLLAPSNANLIYKNLKDQVLRTLGWIFA